MSALPQVRDIGAYIKAVSGIAPRADDGTAQVDGNTIDRSGYFSLVAHCQTGAVTGAPTAVSVEFKVQESDDGTTWTDVPGASVTLTAADSSGEIDVNLETAKKNVRVVANSTFTGGTSPTVEIASAVILGGAEVLPA